MGGLGGGARGPGPEQLVHLQHRTSRKHVYFKSAVRTASLSLTQQWVPHPPPTHQCHPVACSRFKLQPSCLPASIHPSTNHPNAFHQIYTTSGCQRRCRQGGHALHQDPHAGRGGWRLCGPLRSAADDGCVKRTAVRRCMHGCSRPPAPLLMSTPFQALAPLPAACQPHLLQPATTAIPIPTLQSAPTAQASPHRTLAWPSTSPPPSASPLVSVALRCCTEVLLA